MHTDIAYGNVNTYMVTPNDVHIHTWKADNPGVFVAKFLMDEIQALDGLVIGGMNELELVGVTDDELNPETFRGADWVQVMDNVPVKGGK